MHHNPEDWCTLCDDSASSFLLYKDDRMGVCVNRHTMLIAAQKFCNVRIVVTGAPKRVMQFQGQTSFYSHICYMMVMQLRASKNYVYMPLMCILDWFWMRGMKRAGCARGTRSFLGIACATSSTFLLCNFFLCILLVNYIIFNCVLPVYRGMERPVYGYGNVLRIAPVL